MTVPSDPRADPVGSAAPASALSATGAPSDGLVAPGRLGGSGLAVQADQDPSGPLPPVGGMQLRDDDAQRVVQLLASAQSVQRRSQFFVWCQSHLHWLIPHRMMICGSWRRGLRGLQFDLFHTLPLERDLHLALTDGEGPLLTWATREWLAASGGPRSVDLSSPGDPQASAAARQLLDTLGFSHLAIHGLSRPSRREDLETLFVVALRAAGDQPSQVMRAELWLELLLPTLHSVWMRVVANEMRMETVLPRTPVSRSPTLSGDSGITGREREILHCVQRGQSNHQIAELLGISPLTVKNHVQKILRKLGASNRAQAVAIAIARGALAVGAGASRHRADRDG